MSIWNHSNNPTRVISLLMLVAILLAMLIESPEEQSIKIGKSSELTVHSQVRLGEKLAEKLGFKAKRRKAARVTIDVRPLSPVVFDISDLEWQYWGDLSLRHVSKDYFVVCDGRGSETTSFVVKVYPKRIDLEVSTMAGETRTYFASGVGPRGGK